MTDVGVRYQTPASLHEKQRMMRALMNVRQPKTATAEFLKEQDEELKEQAVDKGIVHLPSLLHVDRVVETTNEGGNWIVCPVLSPSGETTETRLLLWQGDITRLAVDAIVNAANAQMLGCWSPLHGCIDNCIHSAAGIQLRQECFEQMQDQGYDEPTGMAKITRGYNLPARYVIHTVGPIVATLRDGRGVPTAEQQSQLASCYWSCLDMAERNGCESIAFCCISTGVFHFPNDRAAEIAISTVRDWMKANPQRQKNIKQVIFNVFLDKDYDIYKRLLCPHC